VLHGDGVKHVTYNFWDPLPNDHATDLSVVSASGRGRIIVVQQPSADNNYTGVIRIHDPQPGRSYYHFVVRWRDAGSVNYHRQDNDNDDDDNG
jgi:hypothetical protein